LPAWLLERDEWVEGAFGATVGAWQEDELRRVLIGGPVGDFSDTLIDELEDQMTEGEE